MSAYVIVDLTPKDAGKLQEYGALAAETLKPFGGEFLTKGLIEVLHGTAPFLNKAILVFPDREKAAA